MYTYVIEAQCPLCIRKVFTSKDMFKAVLNVKAELVEWIGMKRTIGTANADQKAKSAEPFFLPKE